MSNTQYNPAISAEGKPILREVATMQKPKQSAFTSHGELIQPHFTHAMKAYDKYLDKLQTVAVSNELLEQKPELWGDVADFGHDVKTDRFFPHHNGYVGAEILEENKDFTVKEQICQYVGERSGYTRYLAIPVAEPQQPETYTREDMTAFMDWYLHDAPLLMPANAEEILRAWQQAKMPL